MKMEQTEFSETSAYKIQMPGNYPEKNIKQKIFFLLHKIKTATGDPPSPYSMGVVSSFHGGKVARA